jgi:hypothetical protein
MKWRKEIMVEIEREIVIRNATVHTNWCDLCGKATQMFTVKQAAEILGCEEQELLKVSNGERFHIQSNQNGTLSCCADSLMTKVSDVLPVNARKKLTDGSGSVDSIK